MFFYFQVFCSSWFPPGIPIHCNCLISFKEEKMGEASVLTLVLLRFLMTYKLFCFSWFPPGIPILHLVFPLTFLLFQSTLLQSPFLSLINPLPLSLLLYTLKHQCPPPLVNLFLSLFQHLLTSLLTLILCKQGPSLEFTILDCILPYFLFILSLKLFNRPWKIQIGLLPCNKNMMLC